MNPWLVLFLLAAIQFQSSSSLRADEIWERAPKKLPHPEYGVVFDAGSSGTRVMVYKYVKGIHDPIEVSDIEQVAVPSPDKVEPGLSEFVDFTEQIADYLGELMESAKKAIPADHYQDASVILYATAGMRLFPEVEQERVMKEVDCLFSNKTYCPFNYKEGSAQVMSGENEAMAGWVTINFLKGTFSSKCRRETYGALDLGGASTQNTFRVLKKDKVAPTSVLDLGGHKYPVYAHSYLGYGADESRDSFIEYLVHERGLLTDRLIISPCHNNKYRKIVSVEDKNYLLIGKYNGILCKDNIRKKFFCDGKSAKKCPLKNQPELAGHFYGYSAIYYAMHDAGITTSSDEIVSLPKLRLRTHLFCSKSAESLDPAMHDIYALCFRLNYIFELLKDGYATNWKTLVLHVADKINGFEVNWTLGAMLHAFKVL